MEAISTPQKQAFRYLYIILFMIGLSAEGFSQVSAIYAGGPVYRERDYAIEELKNSGFNTLIIWTIHIDQSGNLNFNGEFPLVTDGVYVGDDKFPDFKDDIRELKSATSSINRIEIGLSAWLSTTYDNVQDLVEEEGVGSDSKLYRNFQALKEAIPEIDAVNNDDEGTYDVPSSVAFHTMLYDLGYKTALVPFTAATSYWKPLTEQVNAARPGAIDRLYLQVYAGGAGNNPCSSIWQDIGLPVYPGLWGGGNNDTPEEVDQRMSVWEGQCGIGGGFMWLYDDFDDSPQVEQFANAINNSFNILPDVPSDITARFPSDEVDDISVDEDLTWDAGGFEVTHTVYFGETAELDVSHIVQEGESTFYDPGTLSNDVTYYWKILQSNAGGETESEVWSFTTEVTTDIPAQVTVDHPLNSTNNVSTSPALTWQTAEDAFIYDVYFGPEGDLNFITATRDLSVIMDDLEPNTRYQWRIDARNSAGTTTGEVWDFDTRGINLADDADVEVSSEQGDSRWWGVNLTDGEFLNRSNGEWGSDNENTPYAQLSWEYDQTVGLIVLYGPTDESINILSGTLSFSDGTSIAVGELPVEGGALEISFDSKQISWVRFDIDTSEGDNLGLAEMQVFEFSDAEALPGQARGFEPGDGAGGVKGQVTLRWEPGAYAESHDIYLSTDETIDPSDFILNKSGKFHVATGLQEGTYYWRIDEVNENGTTTGPELTFRVGDVLDIETNNRQTLVYPNPVHVNGQVNFRMDESIKGTVILKIYDVTGQLIYTGDHTRQYQSQAKVSWNASGNQVSGICYAIIESEGKNRQFKLIIQ